ncbi:MAG: VanZ family protein [Clostridia bacterium]|nr:VanZ family protein [Clostridia bacterium]
MISVLYALWSELWESLMHYLLACPVYLLLEWLLCRLYRRKGISYGKGFVVGWQLLMVLLITMFSFTGTAGLEDILRFGTSMIQESSICGVIADKLTLEMLLNILLFIPLGVVLPLLWDNHGVLQNVICGFLLSMLIEFSQLFNFHATDINDLLMNTAGILLGYMIFLVFFRKITVFQAHTSDKLIIAGLGSIMLAFAVYFLLASPIWTTLLL